MNIKEDLFFGRDRELADLTAVISLAASGTGSLTLISGDPGIGKTRLAQQACELAASSGFSVVRGFASEHTGAPPYWIWQQPLRRLAFSSDTASRAGHGSWPRPLSLLLNTDSASKAIDLATSGDSARFVLFDQANQFLESVSESRPVLLFLDDLQWADESSLALLEFITFNLQHMPVLVVATHRSTDSDIVPMFRTFLGDIEGKQFVKSISLEGLRIDEVRELTRALTSSGIDDAEADEIATKTGGNPLFVRELALASASRGVRIPRSVIDVISRRLTSLSSDSRGVLQTAAALGDRFQSNTLINLVGPDQAKLVANALDEAIARNIVRATETPGLMSFSHGLMRESTLAMMPPLAQAQLHSRIANHFEPLAESGDRSALALVAFHAREASGVDGPKRAVAFGLRAADAAIEGLAFAEALELINGVFSLIDDGQPNPSTEEMADAVLLRCTARFMSGSMRPSDWDDLRAALRYSIDHGDAERAERAIFAMPTRSPGIPLEMRDRLMTLLAEKPSARALTLGLLGLAASWSWTDSDANAQDLFMEARNEATEIDDHQTLARIIAIEAWMDFGSARYELAAEKFTEITALLDASGDLLSVFNASLFRLASRTSAGERINGDETARLIEVAEHTRNPVRIAEAHTIFAYESFAAGNWDAVREHCELAMSRRGYASVALGMLATTELECGGSRTELVDEYLNSLLALNWSTEFLRGGAIIDYGAITSIARAEGSTVRLSIIENLFKELNWQAPGSGSLMPNEWLMTMAAVGQVAWMKRDEIAAVDVYRLLKEFPGRRSGPPGMIASDELIGMAAHLVGHRAEAQEHFELARELYRRIAPRGGRNLPWLCITQVEALIDGGAMDDARVADVIAEGVEVAERLGMITAANRLRTLETEARGTKSAASYPDNLTTREVEVLRELAQGRSNRDIAEILFISPNTVIRHVSNIFAKTGCSSRAEAGAYAQRMDLLD